MLWAIVWWLALQYCKRPYARRVRSLSGLSYLPCRTLEVLKLLRERNSDAKIIALAVLPRGWTDAWHVYEWPSMYKRGIDVINRALKDFAAQDDAVHYLDCGPAVTPGGQVSPPTHLRNYRFFAVLPYIPEAGNLGSSPMLSGSRPCCQS